MEVKKDYSLVMKDDSQIVRVKNKDGMKTGDINIFLEEDIYKEERKNNSKKMIISILSIAAVISVFILPFIKNNALTSYALVSLDINPSIQFELDANKNITDVKGLNEDGKSLDISQIKGLSLDDGMKKLNQILNESNYHLNGDTMIVGFAFLTNEEDFNYENDVKNIIGIEFKETKAAYFKGTKEETEQAKNKGISLGRYEAKLSLDEDIMEEQIESMSVEEILNLLDNKSKVYLNEEMKDELQDELEDRLEDTGIDKDENSNDESDDDEDKEDDDKEDDDDDENEDD